MVLEWLFGERKKQEGNSAAIANLLARANAATNERDSIRGEVICRDILQLAPNNADAWNMLGVNLIRRGIGVPQMRAEAVIAWMRALALRPGDMRAADHLRAEIQFPDELIPVLLERLSEVGQVGDDAAAVLTQIGTKAKNQLEKHFRAPGKQGERVRAILAAIS
jgi:hypothetical protein